MDPRFNQYYAGYYQDPGTGNSPIYPWLNQFQMPRHAQEPANPAMFTAGAFPATPPIEVQSQSQSATIPVPSKKRERWTETEEKILIALYGERVQALKYKAHNSPEWLALCTDLKQQCQSQNVPCSKTAQQCKNKLAQLTKKYKEAKDKLKQTGYGDGDNTVTRQKYDDRT